MSVVVKAKTVQYQNAVGLLAFISSQYPFLVGRTLEEIVARLSPTRHSADFRSVRWFGKNYEFSPAQSLIVQALWHAWLNGTPRMGAKSLIRAANMVSDKVSDLFKDHRAWNKMICTDNKGNYWLSES